MITHVLLWFLGALYTNKESAVASEVIIAGGRPSELTPAHAVFLKPIADRSLTWAWCLEDVVEVVSTG